MSCYREKWMKVLGGFPLRWGGLLLLVLLTIGGCRREQPPLKVGFLGVLTGRGAPLGVSGRNAAQLAVHEANARGGIQGRRVELVVKDSGMNADTTRRALEEFSRLGVSAVIGPMTSSMGIVAAEHGSKVPLISPTVATQDLSGRKDHFFRVYPDISTLASQLTGDICRQPELRRFAIVSDEDNASFTRYWDERFESGLKSCGGEVVARVPYHSSQTPSFQQLAAQLGTTDHDGLFILANASDTALFAQQLHKQQLHVPIFCSEWSSSTVLVSMGGAAVEGMSWVQGFPYGRQSPRFEQFRRSYVERFGKEPDFAASYAYEASRLLFTALRRFPESADLSRSLQQIRSLEGLFDTIEFDGYGEVKRPLYLSTIRQGQFTGHER